jgi:SRSO17 transposase
MPPPIRTGSGHPRRSQLRSVRRPRRPAIFSTPCSATSRARQDGRAEAAGDPGPWRQQALLGRGRWDVDAFRDVVRDYVVEHPAADDAVLVVDETGFLKRGRTSCGVGRQYTGSAGKITNCQIGVFAAYVSHKGHAFIDRALYLPKAWTSAPVRMKAAHVPDGVAFATKPALAAMMISRAIDAGVPFAWVAADSVYGVGDVETALRRAGRGYVLGVNANHWFGAWNTTPLIAGEAKDIAKDLPAEAWQRLSAGLGTKGERFYDWAYPYFTTWCPHGTSIDTLVRVKGTRWRMNGERLKR